MVAVVESPLDALGCDRAYSMVQFRRRWPEVDPAQLPGVVVVQHQIPETSKGSPLTVDFVVLKSFADEPAFALRHLAGVAEMRYALRVPIEEWAGDAGRVHLDSTPDAVWYSRTGPCAIEYDLRYNRKQVLQKQQDYRRMYVCQYWGVAIPSRAQYLRRTLQPDPYTVIMLNPWL